MSTNHAKCPLITPEPYEGNVEKAGSPEGEQWTVIEAATYLDLPPLILRIGGWAISREGIHSLVIDYNIVKERFDESDWIEHVTEKTWVNERDFSSIFRLAKSMVELEMI